MAQFTGVCIHEESRGFSVIDLGLFSSSGSIPRALHRRAEGPPEELVTGGPHEAVWEPQERSQRHKES